MRHNFRDLAALSVPIFSYPGTIRWWLELLLLLMLRKHVHFSVGVCDAGQVPSCVTWAKRMKLGYFHRRKKKQVPNTSQHKRLLRQTKQCLFTATTLVPREYQLDINVHLRQARHRQVDLMRQITHSPETDEQIRLRLQCPATPTRMRCNNSLNMNHTL